MRVNEISLSMGNDPSAQFVELLDLTNEPFTFAPPYKVVFFDSSGAEIAEHDLGNTLAGRVEPDTVPFLLATDSANLGSRDADLNVAIPAGSGSVCFTRGLVETRIHCVAYGCPAGSPSAESGTQIGRAPANDESLQQINASLFIGAPSPKAANSATGAAGCPGSPGTGPGSGGTGTGNPGGPSTGAPGAGTGGTDNRAPRAVVSAKKRQDIDRLALAARPDEQAVLRASATVNVPGAARSLRFKTVTRTVRAGALARLRLRLSARNLRTAKRALRRGRRLTARTRLTARDPSGNTSTTRRNIRLTN